MNKRISKQPWDLLHIWIKPHTALLIRISCALGYAQVCFQKFLSGLEIRKLSKGIKAEWNVMELSVVVILFHALLSTPIRIVSTAEAIAIGTPLRTEVWNSLRKLAW